MLSHALGMIGEFINFLGAITLALDIFLRKRERAREERLKQIAELARKFGLNRTFYRGCRITGSEFPWNVFDKRATTIAYLGTALLAVGFIFLTVHHWIELREEMDRSAIKRVSCDNICPNNGF